MPKGGGILELFKLYGSIALNDGDFNKKIGDATGKAESFGDKFNNITVAVGKAAVVGLGAAATAFAGLSVKALQLGGDLEQNLGGAEAVFGQFAETAIETSKEAFETAGLSASDYLATINKMGSLMMGSGIEQEKALDLSSAAMQRAADVASIMGIDTTSAMESIAGAAKGNFTMMDNLGVAMNATTIEAYALSKGIETSYKDMDNATKIGLAMEMFLEKTAYAAGNYAKENETLAGSINTARAAMTNFLAGAGEVDAVVDSFSNAADVIVKNLDTLLPRLTTGIVKIIEGLAKKVPALMDSLLPPIVKGAVALVKGFANAIISNLPLIVSTGKKVVTAFLSGIGDIVPLFKPITAALSFLSERLLEITPIAATFFAVWKGVEFLAFLETSGSVAKALGTIKTATEALTLAKLNDIRETIILNAMYAKDFVMNLAKGTVELAKQAVQFGITTAAKVQDTIATWSAAAAQEGITLVHYALNLALASSAVQWIKSTALKVADTVATTALSIATGIATAAQWLFNAALTANPIGLIIIGIAGLAAGMVALANKLSGAKKSQDDVTKSTREMAKGQEALTDTLSDNESAFESYADVATDMFKRINTESELSIDDMIENLRENRKAVEDFYKNLEVLARRGVDEGLIQYLREEGPAAMAGTAQMLAAASGEKLQAASREWARSAGIATIDGYEQGVRESVNGRIFGGGVKQATDTVKRIFKSELAIGSPSKVFEEYGKFTMDGFINGLTGMIDKIKSTMKNIADTVTNTITKILGIKSPSTVFAGFGENTGQGFINGIIGMSNNIRNAVDSVFGDLGGDIGYSAAFDANGSISDIMAELQIENGMRMGTSPSFEFGTSGNGTTKSASVNPIYYVNVNVSADNMDSAAKVVRVFENFTHNRIIYEGVQ